MSNPQQDKIPVTIDGSSNLAAKLDQLEILAGLKSSR